MSPGKFLYEYPQHPTRGPHAWANPLNWIRARRIARTDNSNEWRYAFHRGAPVDQNRTETFARLAKKSQARARGPEDPRFRFLILADTGEGDRSQYALLPAINGLDPDFMIINGDVAYPAGNLEDFEAGFFQPYAGMGVPIWAVPGNHEYYSRGNGEEFFEVFCTRRHADLWERYGLDFVPQPATYWMIRDESWPRPPDGSFRLGVIGLDTGHSGNLDGAKKYGVGPIRFGPRSFRNDDSQQHSWLHTRLKEADDAGAAVIVLFHIPELVNEDRDERVHLDTLHDILADHACVRLVVCGHIHNYQRYAPQLFQRFLRGRQNRPPTSNPDYIVAGAGGAYLSSTDFGRGTRYGPADVFPTPAQFNQYVRGVRAGLQKVGLGRSAWYRLAEKIKKAEVLDDDPVEYGSFLCVDVYDDRAVVRSFFVENLEELYPEVGEGATIALADRAFALAQSALSRCFEKQPAITLR